MNKKIEISIVIIFVILICSTFLGIFDSSDIKVSKINNVLSDTNDGNNISIAIEYVSRPQKLLLNETYNSSQYPGIKIKLLKIDVNNNKCLLKNEGPSIIDAAYIKVYGNLADIETLKKALKDMNDTQWFKKGEAIFPYIYGNIGVVIENILSNEIYFEIRGGKILSGEQAEKFLEDEKKAAENNDFPL